MSVAHRIDPYKTFKFQIAFVGGETILGVSKVGPLKRTTEVIKHRDGGDNSNDYPSPGHTNYDPIIIERGITFNAHQFEEWANWVHHNSEGDVSGNRNTFRRDLILTSMDENGIPCMRYILYGCWVSDFTALPELDANSNSIAIESITIQLNRWKRDLDLPEPPS
jgi:phage tail-like protein